MVQCVRFGLICIFCIAKSSIYFPKIFNKIYNHSKLKKKVLWLENDRLYDQIREYTYIKGFAQS